MFFGSNKDKSSGIAPVNVLDTKDQDPDIYLNVLETIPINVMLCDKKSFKITYANQKSIETLSTLRHLIPIDPKDLIGTCIDAFHKVPSHQRAMLDDPRNLPYQTVITLGDEFLDLFVTAMGSDTFILTWSIVTEKIKTEKETVRLMNMVDNMPLNVMTCDPESFEIDYINQTSVTTLRTIEHLLPITAEQALGSCIDIFHKKPMMQRGLLSDPSNLPHRARVTLGDETLDLNISAIKDGNQTYLGPMVTWDIVTELVAGEREVLGISEGVAAAATELSSTSETMSQIAIESGHKTNAVSDSAQQTTASIQGVASATEELTASIREILRNTEEGEKITQKAVTETSASKDMIEKLSQSANEIGEVIKLIEEIANQTNLLALNATIEAARAGDAGKGFAVVAGEVKALSGQTRAATTEISTKITDIQQATTAVVKAIEEISTTVDVMSGINGEISAAVHEQNNVTSDISASIQMEAQRSQEVSADLAQISLMIDNTGASSGEINSAASELSRLSTSLTESIRKMLSPGK